MISKLQISLNHPKAGTAIVWIAFFAIVLSAWAALFFMTMTSPLFGAPRDLRRALCGGAIDTGLGAPFDVTCSSSLHNGFDEPEHSIAQTPKPVRWVLKSDNVREEISMFEPRTYNRYDPGVLLVHL
jgi:hypothetical protein